MKTVGPLLAALTVATSCQRAGEDPGSGRPAAGRVHAAPVAPSPKPAPTPAPPAAPPTPVGRLWTVWADGDHVFAGGDDFLLTSRDGGKAFERQRLAGCCRVIGIWGTSADDVYAVGMPGVILHSTDRGHSWVRENISDSATLFQVWGPSADDVYAVGDQGTILHSTDRGATWTKLHSKKGLSLGGIWGSSADDIVVVGYATRGVEFFARMLHSSDRGRTWNRQSLGFPWSLHDVWGTPGGDRFAVGSEGVIARSSDSGRHWKQVGGVIDRGPNTLLDATTLSAVAGDDSGQVWAVGDGATILTTKAPDREWHLESLPPVPDRPSLGIDLYSITHAGGGVMWAAGFGSDPTILYVSGADTVAATERSADAPPDTGVLFRRKDGAWQPIAIELARDREAAPVRRPTP